MQTNVNLGLAQALASYFGDDDAVPGGLCGMCTYCKTGEAVTFDPKATTSPDPNKIRVILNSCPERDDPRLLARMAFGISSPRLTIGKWSTSHPYFGSMVDVDFNMLVAVFDEECKKAGYAKADTPITTLSTSKKRTLAQVSGNRGYYGNGAGAGETSKRGKYYR